MEKPEYPFKFEKQTFVKVRPLCFPFISVSVGYITERRAETWMTPFFIFTRAKYKCVSWADSEEKFEFYEWRLVRDKELELRTKVLNEESKNV